MVTEYLLESVDLQKTHKADTKKWMKPSQGCIKENLKT